jgi:hypothetical protein
VAREQRLAYGGQLRRMIVGLKPIDPSSLIPGRGNESLTYEGRIGPATGPRSEVDVQLRSEERCRFKMTRAGVYQRTSSATAAHTPMEDVCRSDATTTQQRPAKPFSTKKQRIPRGCRLADPNSDVIRGPSRGDNVQEASAAWTAYGLHMLLLGYLHNGSSWRMVSHAFLMDPT